MLDWVDVEYCFPLNKDPLALDRLVQPDSTKDIIRMLFQDFKQASAPALQSPERQKRPGNLTILLHGNSGTGKRYVRNRFRNGLRSLKRLTNYW